MRIISKKRIDFKSEERAIRNQVSQGLRCADCLRLFNRGERKNFKAGTGSVICQRCHATESPEIPREEAIR